MPLPAPSEKRPAGVVNPYQEHLDAIDRNTETGGFYDQVKKQRDDWEGLWLPPDSPAAPTAPADHPASIDRLLSPSPPPYVPAGGPAPPAPGAPPVASSGGGAAPPVSSPAPVPSDGFRTPQPGLGAGGPAPQHSTGFLAPSGGGQPIDTGGVHVPTGGGPDIDTGSGGWALNDPKHPDIGPGGGGPAPPDGTQPSKVSPAMQALQAKDAAFARAKDSIGQTMRASMTALRENLAGRGGLGGGLETGGMSSLIGEGGNVLSDVVTNQANYDVGQQNQAANQRYAGALTKRGQDLGLTQSMLSLLGSQAY